MKTPEVPVSWGELIDKVTILEIKSRRLTSAGALDNVNRELKLLAARAQVAIDSSPEVRALKTQLHLVNETLWAIEDKIRDKESQGMFDAQFIALARSVYKENDERARIKRQINTALLSELVEEKSYSQY